MQQSNSDRWWDGTNPDTFFATVYRAGDDSLEGHAEDAFLDVRSRTLRECDMVERLLSLNPGMRILDCPCGYGRHSIELASRGYHVVGVDLCPTFLKEARSTLERLSIQGSCEFIQGDMRNLPQYLGNFDACLNMFLSFGFFSDEENLRVLQEFHRVLGPKGSVLIHSDLNPERAEQGNFRDRGIRHLRNGGVLAVDEEFDSATGLLTGTWTLLQEQRILTRGYSIHIYSHKQMSELFNRAGFNAVNLSFPFAVSDQNIRLAQEVVYHATRE
jgi:ubiquinone/menaquinone biosynthesis C-methylase UbiE